MCWERKSAIPGDWTFFRAFAVFAESQLPERVHEALIHKSYAGEIVGHISRDSTAIEAREKRVKTVAKTAEAPTPRKRGRPKKGEECIKEPTRLERQIAGISLTEMLDDLAKACNVGTKQNSKGYKSKLSTTKVIRLASAKSSSTNVFTTRAFWSRHLAKSVD
jgi:hypothetical protein